MSKILAAIYTIIGTIIGAGFLGIPYVAMKAGFPIVLILLILISSIMMLTMLYLGEIILRTKSTHQLVGYAEKYLGKSGKMIMLISFVVGIYAALVAYIIAQGESWSMIFFQNKEYSIFFGIAFWILISTISRNGLMALKKTEFIGVSFAIIMILSLGLFNAKKINPLNLIDINFKFVLLPLGVIIFAFLGYSIMPEIKKILGKQTNKMKKVIIISHTIVLFIYITFVIIVLGIFGKSTPQIATLALGKPFIFLGIITIFTASVALSNALIDTLHFDLKKSKKNSWLICTGITLAIYLIVMLTKKTDFITTIALSGIISGGITLIMILKIIPKAKLYGDRVPEYSIPYSKIIGQILTLIFLFVLFIEFFNII